jgi:hypothetical protein
MKRSEVIKAIREVLDEMSVSGDAGGYSTPFAFSKKGQGKNKATLESEKLGFKTVQRPKHPSHTKMFDYLDEMHMATPHMFVSEEELYNSEPVKRSEEMGMKLVHKNKKASEKKK